MSTIASPTQESRASRMMRELFESGRPLTYVHTVEESRVAHVLREVARHLYDTTHVEVWTWSLTEGLHRDGHDAEPGTFDPAAALSFIDDYSDAAIFHLKDFHEPLRESAEIRRRTRDLYERCLDRKKFLVITSPVQTIPEELERTMLFVQLRLPDAVELADFVQQESGTPEC